MLCQELHLSVAKPTAADSARVNYIRKDTAVVNYRWGQKRVFSLFLRKIECEKSNFHF